MTALFLSAVKNPKGGENGKRTNNVRSYAANSTTNWFNKSLCHAATNRNETVIKWMYWAKWSHSKSISSKPTAINITIGIRHGSINWTGTRVTARFQYRNRRIWTVVSKWNRRYDRINATIGTACTGKNHVPIKRIKSQNRYSLTRDWSGNTPY